MWTPTYHDALRPFLQRRAGMVAPRQLRALAVDWDHVDATIAAGRWVERTPRVIRTVTGDLTHAQRCWLAVLHAGPRSMLRNLSAAARHGLTGWEHAAVHVMVDDELSFESVDGVDFFRCRRPFDLKRCPKPGIPTCRLEPSVLLWAAYEAPHRAAHGRRQSMRAPDRQVRHRDRDDRPRWTDTESALPDGRVARCTAYELIHRSGEVATDLVALGVARVTHPRVVCLSPSQSAV